MADNMISFLTKNNLFRDLSPKEIEEQILPWGTVRRMSKGSFLLQPQDRLDYFGLIRRGRVHIMHVFQDGSVSIMDAMEPGEEFGADLICTKSRISPYHAVAAEDVELLTFPSKIVLQPGSISEPVRYKIRDQLLTQLAQNNMKKEYRLAILSRKGLRDRIMTYLTMQASKRHTNSFEIPFSREELASFLCVNRSALSHELSLMRAEGILTFRKNSFTIHSAEQ